MKYFDELKRAMDFLASHEKTIFIGQAVAYPGTAMTNTLKDVSKQKLYEMPVTEEMQMGVSTGLGIDGWIPINIYPRWNFLLLSVNQLVNHLDRLPHISNDGYKPKIIIRTGIGSERPLHPQHQHIGDFTEFFKNILENIEVIRLEEPEDIFPAYKKALNRKDGRQTLLVEYGDYYSEK